MLCVSTIGTTSMYDGAVNQNGQTPIGLLICLLFASTSGLTEQLYSIYLIVKTLT